VLRLLEETAIVATAPGAAMSEDFIPVIKEDGTPLSDEEVARISKGLDALNEEDRVAARNENADGVADCDAARMLIVSGPGTGKSTLFKKRLTKWLEIYPDRQVAVATFVRKLVRDLGDDVATDAEMSEEDKARVEVMTLHRMARSIVERNHGTQDVALAPYCAVVTGRWEEMVWADAVSLHEELQPGDFPWSEIRAHLYDGNPPTDGDWGTLRQEHVRVEKFYNALTFPDLILFATSAVRENPELVEDTLFIIDEFQDFNLAENAFIEALTAESPAQLLVGDDDQVLYDGLRRAHPSIIRGYYEDRSFANAMLPFCGRCSIHICRTAEAFLERERSAESIKKVFLPLQREEADMVTVVATTSPKVGVAYVQDVLNQHDAGIKQREEEIRAGSAKDAYLLILTPAREMKYLNVGGALNTLQGALSAYAIEDDRPGDAYWRLRDYYYAAVHPSQNYNVRKVLAHEGVEQDVVASLLKEALESGKNLADLGAEAITSALDKCSAIREIIDADLAPTDQAKRIAGLLDADTAQLTKDLENMPIRSDVDADVESFDLEQKEAVSAVEVTTIVGAKGLSADHVIVLGCDDVNLDRVSACAFFVALTRARKSLTLMACIGGGGANVLHAFVCALPDDHTQAIYAKTGGAKEYETISELQNQLEKWRNAKSMANKARAKLSRS